MEYGYKITSNGRAAVMAALDLGRPLRITRAAVGSGTVEEGTDLADVHVLKAYAAEAAIVGRRHEENQLFLTVQYSNRDCQEAFTIGEFMVYAADPETGREMDFLYATLGDYRQPVPPYTRGVPSGVWEFPLIVAASEQLRLEITASPGLITDNDLRDAVDRLKLEIMTNELTLPLSAAGGEELLTSSGTPLLAVYHPNQLPAALAAVAALDERLSGAVRRAAAGARTYADGMGQRAQAGANAYTDGKVLDLTEKINTAKAEAVAAAGTNAAAKVQAAKDDLTEKIGTAKQEAVSAASADAAAKVKAAKDDLTGKISAAKTAAVNAAENKDKVVEKRLIYRIANDFNKHNSAGSAHPGTLAVSGLTPPFIQIPVPEDVEDILDDYIDILNPI